MLVFCGGYVFFGNDIKLNKLDKRFVCENDVCCYNNVYVYMWEWKGKRFMFEFEGGMGEYFNYLF